MSLNFRDFFEATFDPKLTNIYKTKWGDKTGIGRTFSLKVEKGQILPLSKEDYEKSYRFPHFAISPNAKQIDLQNISPQSEDFRQLINALKSKYNDIGDWEVHVFGQSGHMETGNKKYHRTVSYWIRQNTVKLNDRMPEYFYHGTSTNLWYEGINKNGLLPRKLSGSTGSYGAQNVESLSQDTLVYLSTHIDSATRTASQQSSNKYGGQPLILRIKSSGLFPEKFQPDEDSKAKTAADSIRQMSIVGYAGRIPASIIEPFLLGIKDDTKNRIGFKWKKFHDVEPTEHPLTAKLKDGFVPYSGDPEYYALKDAGIIKKEEGYSNTGHRYSNNILTRSVSDKELKEILKNSKWVTNVRFILKDLDKHYEGILYKLKGLKIPENISKEQQKIIDILLDSKLLLLNHGYYDVYHWDSEDKAIKLAKSMGKMSFKEMSDIINKIAVNKA